MQFKWRLIQRNRSYPSWFAEKYGIYTPNILKDSDVFLCFQDGNGSTIPEIDSLKRTISSFVLPQRRDQITPIIALALVLKQKLQFGIPVYCLDGSFDEN